MKLTSANVETDSRPTPERLLFLQGVLFSHNHGVGKINLITKFITQGAARLLDLNLRWWEKGGVGIIEKGTSRSFVFPWVSDWHVLVEAGTSVCRGGLLFKWPLHCCNSMCFQNPVQYSYRSSTSQPLWVNTFRVTDNVEKNTRDLQRA